MLTTATRSEDNCFLEGKLWQTRQCFEKQRHYSAYKGSSSQGCGLPIGHIRLWELDCKEGRLPKNWCLWTAVLERTSESPLDSKKIKPVNLKGDQPWIFTGRTEAEAPVFWLSDVNRWLIGKVPDAGKDWGQKEKRVSEDEVAGRHHQCNEHELGQTLGGAKGQGGWCAAVHRVAKSWTQLGDWRTTTARLRANWRRQWHPTPVLLPGESHGRRSLVGFSPWGR